MRRIIYRDHKEVRAKHYPSINDQLDALWKALEHIATKNKKDNYPADVKAIVKQIQEVKKMYPKQPKLNTRD